MLGKLFKQEWKATWKMPAVFLLGVVALTAISCIALSFPMPMADGMNETAVSIFYNISLLFFFILSAFAVSAGSIFVLIYFAYRFYKSMFTSEGYLTHTLPVTGTKLLISKSLCGILWSFIMSVATLLSVVLMIFCMIDGILRISGSGLVMADLLQEFSLQFGEINDMMIQYVGYGMGTFALITGVLMIVGCFSSILLPYLCLSLGQLFKKHRVAAAVGFYFAAYFIIQIVTSLITFPLTMRSMFTSISTVMENEAVVALSPMSSFTPIYIVSILLSITISATAFCVTNYIIKKKLNLE